MIEIRQTEIYASQFARLRDQQARARIDVRIRRLLLGNPGDVRPVGSHGQAPLYSELVDSLPFWHEKCM